MSLKNCKHCGTPVDYESHGECGCDGERIEYLERMNESMMAVFSYALSCDDEDGIEFLQLWSDGDFCKLKSFGDVPKAVFYADATHVAEGSQ
jgi:hypothetical protein